jgi:hypothetical protein
MQYVFVGDEAFPLLENLMRPYPGNNLSHEKKIFNYRLNRTRRYIECTFGILANKWRIFHCPPDVHIDFAIDIVKSVNSASFYTVVKYHRNKHRL